MAVVSKIKFVQNLNAPPAGQALDGVVGVPVVATNEVNTDVQIWKWTMIDVIPGSAIPVGVPSSASSFTFTPDTDGGTFLLELSVYDAAGRVSTSRLAVVVKDAYGHANPPFSATAPMVNIGGQTRGWAPFNEDYFSIVRKLRQVGGAAPSNGYVLTWVTANNRAEWVAGGGGGAPSGPAGGDLAGTYPNPTVIGLTGAAGIVLSQATTLAFDKAVASPTIKQNTLTSDVAPQDLTLTPQAPFVSAVTNLVSGNLNVQFTAVGGSTAGPFLNLKYNGVYPIRLGNYSSGAYGAIWFMQPSPGISNWAFLGDASASYFNAPSTQLYFGIGATYYATMDTSSFRFGASYSSPDYKFDLSHTAIFHFTNNATSASIVYDPISTGNGATLAIRGQDSSFTNGNGGPITISSGAKNGTGKPGNVQLRLDTTVLIEAAQVIAGNNVVALAKKTGLTSTEMPANTGDGVIFIANAATAPTASPVSGFVTWGDANGYWVRSPSGNVTQLAPP